MIIECFYCEAKVDARIIASHVNSGEYVDETYDVFEPDHKVYLLACPSCERALIARQYVDGDEELTGASRIWPKPEVGINREIPRSVRISLEEARRCFKARAYHACAVMCGRVLEGISSEYKTKDRSLAGGLKELLDRGIIDKRIYEWGEALRKHRNIAAHTSDERINKEDASDLLDFANAICEYVFVLSKKFEKFMSRKSIKEG